MRPVVKHAQITRTISGDFGIDCHTWTSGFSLRLFEVDLEEAQPRVVLIELLGEFVLLIPFKNGAFQITKGFGPWKVNGQAV